MMRMILAFQIAFFLVVGMMTVHHVEAAEQRAMSVMLIHVPMVELSDINI